MHKNSKLDLKNNSHEIAEQLAVCAVEFSNHPEDQRSFERFLTLINQVYTESLACKLSPLEKASNALLKLMNEMSQHSTQRTVDQILAVSSAAFEVQSILRNAENGKTVESSASELHDVELVSKGNHSLSKPIEASSKFSSNDVDDVKVRRHVDQEIKAKIAEEIRQRLSSEDKPLANDVSGLGSEPKVSESVAPTDFLISDESENDPSVDTPQFNSGSFFKIKVSDSLHAQTKISNRIKKNLNSSTLGEDSSSLTSVSFIELLQSGLSQVLVSVLQDAAQLQVSSSEKSDDTQQCALALPVAIFNAKHRGQLVFLFPESTATRLASKMLGFSLEQLDDNVRHTVSALIRLASEALQKYFETQNIELLFSISNMMGGEIIHYAAKQSEHRTIQFKIPTIGLFTIETTLHVR